MVVYGFVGESGTGKSYMVGKLAKKMGARYIIDDGLLIDENKVLGGKSAKKEKTKIASVRRALFNEDAHAESVKKLLASCEGDIVIVGTSEKMVSKITVRLGLAEPSKIINIEDVSSEKEMEIARKSRSEEGKHVIPVPSFEIKKDFSGYWLDTLRSITAPRKSRKNIDEKTVVRPTFSYMGDFKISNTVLLNICSYEALKVSGVSKVLLCFSENVPEGVEFTLEIVVRYGVNIKACAEEVKKRIREAVEYMTAINVEKVNITVRTLNRDAKKR